MGNQTSTRSSHYQRPPVNGDDSMLDEPPEEHHISISNKMVERLVEDATLADGAAAVAPPIPKGDYKDKMYMERLRCMDEKHSERTGLTVNDLHALTARIDMRTANMVSVEPVCEDCHDRVIECYNSYDRPEDNFKCWDTVVAFTACVNQASAKRLRARTQRDAREHARRSRHMALAREHELRDLGRVEEPIPFPT